MVIGNGKAPQLLITAYLPGNLPGSIVNNLSDLLTIRQQRTGKQADAEFSIGQIDPCGSSQAIGIGL